MSHLLVNLNYIKYTPVYNTDFQDYNTRETDSLQYLPHILNV